MRNSWLVKKQEKLMLRVIEWAQKNNFRVESLTKAEIVLAIKELKYK